MRQYRFHAFVVLAAVAAGIAGAMPASAADWKPTRPINLIVPWAAGGSTDQVTRATAAELEPVLGQKIVVINQENTRGCAHDEGGTVAEGEGAPASGIVNQKSLPFPSSLMTPIVPPCAATAIWANVSPRPLPAAE